MTLASASANREIEPLVRLSDLEEYRQGLARRLAGDWDEDKWTGFRTRFGVYGQKQAGVQMIRIKIPGGLVPVPWLSAVARFNREFCQGDAHITTRQDFQVYFIPLERTVEALEFLYTHGLTTREACGNTFRNITACSLAGSCPRELVDAGIVADRVSRAWLRDPLVQHMPRKVKASVSGCATDCGASGLHDLTFIAVERDGKQGFTVMAAGGLGGQPRPAVKVLDFVTEDELSTVVEATARLHQKYSDRINRNSARLKFIAKRFGEEKFAALFQEHFEALRGLPQRPWQPLEWRKPSDVAIGRTPVGAITQHDGRVAIVGNPPLGNLSSDQLEALAELAIRLGVPQIRITRDQNIVLPDLAPALVAEAVAALKSINIEVPDSDAENVDVISCPGTTTCRIGITNSQNFARAVWEDAKTDATAKGVAVRISGCQNSCGLHHVADFGFHGVAKKVDGQPAPHYQIHLGGDARQVGAIGLGGPIVHARHAVDALRLLRQGYAQDKQSGETVRVWADRIGKAGIAALLKPLDDKNSGENTFVDWGDDEAFKGAPTLRGECAAPMASDDLLADMADDGLLRFDRFLTVGRWEEALKAAEDAVWFASRRLLQKFGQETTDEDAPILVAERLRELAVPQVSLALDDAEAERIAALSSGRADGYRETVMVVIDTIRAIVDAVPEEQEAAE